MNWQVAPIVILETEKQYPGLFDDLSIESWQRRLVKEQIEGAKKVIND